MTMQDSREKSPAEILDDVYKWLLAATTFLDLVIWDMVTYIPKTVFEHPELNNTLGGTVYLRDLLLGPQFQIIATIPLILSFLVFMFVATTPNGPVAKWGRFLSYLLLSYTISIIAVLVVGGWVLAILNLPGPSNADPEIEGIAFIISTYLSLRIVQKAYSSNLKELLEAIRKKLSR